MDRARGLTVAVTALDSRDNPQPGLAVARCLKAAPRSEIGRVVGLTSDPMSAGVWAGVCDVVFMAPVGRDCPTLLLERLADIHRSQHIDVIMPSSDVDVSIYAHCAPALAELGIGVLVPDGETLSRRAKPRLFDFCRTCGFYTPATVCTSSVAQLESAIRLVGLPVVVKGPIAGARVATTTAHAVALWRDTFSRCGGPVLVQEFTEGAEINVAGVFGRDHALLDALGIRKLKITDRGKAAAGVSVRSDPYIELLETIGRQLRWVGPLELEIIERQSDGKASLIEINPRFPAWIGFTAHREATLPRLAALAAAGIEPRSAQYPVGLSFERLADNHLLSLDALAALSCEGRLRQNRRHQRKARPRPAKSRARRSLVYVVCSPDTVRGQDLLQTLSDFEPRCRLVALMREPGAAPLVGGARLETVFAGTDAAASHGVMPLLRGHLNLDPGDHVFVVPGSVIDVDAMAVGSYPRDRWHPLVPRADEWMSDDASLEWLAGHDIATAERRTARTPAELLAALELVTFPCIVQTNGLRDFVESYADALGLFDPSDTLSAPVTACPVRRDDYLIEVALVVGLDGGILGEVAVRKTSVDRRHQTWSAMTIAAPRPRATARRVAAALGWTGGPLSVEFIASGKSGDARVTRVTPLLPDWTWLAARAGVALPLIAASDARRRRQEPKTEYALGQLLARCCRDVVCDPLESARQVRGNRWAKH